MPVLTGVKCLKACQQRPAACSVLRTPRQLPHTLEQLRQLPSAGVPGKPLATEELRRLLAQHFPE